MSTRRVTFNASVQVSAELIGNWTHAEAMQFVQQRIERLIADDITLGTVGIGVVHVSDVSGSSVKHEDEPTVDELAYDHDDAMFGKQDHDIEFTAAQVAAVNRGYKQAMADPAAAFAADFPELTR